MTATANPPAIPAADGETARRADLPALAELLVSQRARSVDVVAPARRMSFTDGNLVIAGVQPDISADGVTPVDGTYRLGKVGLESLATALGIARPYAQRTHRDAPALFDINANYWLTGALPGGPDGPGDDRKFLVRLLRSATAGPTAGMVRAVLSNSYLPIDNLDILEVVIEGLADAGVDLADTRMQCDLTERRMVVKVHVPSLAVAAPSLLGDYRSPFDGRSGRDLPLVFAGLVFSNSEVGQGRWTVAPRLVYQVCGNGATITRLTESRVHLGARLDEGIIRWSAATQKANLNLIKAKTQDAVRTFLSTEFVDAQITELTRAAGIPVPDAGETIKVVTRQVGLTGDIGTSILHQFIRGADPTAGGVMNAFTAAAQTVDDGDLAWWLESRAVDAMLAVPAAVR